MTRMFLAAAALAVALFSASAMAQDRAVSPDTLWRLQSLAGEPVTGEVTLQIGTDGSVSGTASCNRYVGQNTAELPAFAVGPMAMTRMACPDMALEAAYMAALETMTQAVIIGDRLVLSDEGGTQLVFAPDA